MPVERMADQAAGLRLLSRASTRVIAVSAARAGLGTTSVVINLAAMLSRAGKDVLILDEYLTHDNVANTLALKPRYDLLNVVRREKSLQEITLQQMRGVRILPVARAIQSLPALSALECERLPECLAEASRGMDIVLVDAASSGRYSLSGSLATDQPLLLVLNTTPAAITESYAQIKRMALQDGRREFGIVINKVHDEQKAHAVFNNLSQVARHHLQVQVEYLGAIPFDEKLKRATRLSCPVLDAFPDAPSTLAFGELGNRLMWQAYDYPEAGGLPDVAQRLMRQAHVQNLVRAY